MLGIGERQVRRLLVRYEEEGISGLLHKSRGREGNNRICDEIRERILSLYQAKYYDFGPTFASEKLEELDKIKVDHDTLRKWLKKSGIECIWVRKNIANGGNENRVLEQ
jgi:transposase